ncbi:Metallo-dependent phosphatase-like protein [Emericellopsis atlantica]|uniref:Metallo-dependent phosphatase-like protein n=1 Tax=Emericellopsis atlantica TaxID=2614577 RepID=A0A9P7ZM57_9HYPO|nr:Metallo-dependent phosphatase-like protein [Emericellopsis atlantica]KAG9254237.1 Metallo-dependent phosphatase-like protein [Emericellopsis atlantica]
MSSSKIKTRIVILSDTHGAKPKPRTAQDPDSDTELSQNHRIVMRLPTGFRHPLPEADVLIHCGDLTKRSRTEEFEATFSMLRDAPAKLKLVIAGNHDGALDAKFWDRYADEQSGRPGDDTMPQQAWRIIKEAEQDNVRFLDEGTHTFALDNGAVLRLYASPWTPEYGLWGFQYDVQKGHSFDIPEGIDVVMTHGPAKGILDLTRGHDHAGCPFLLSALEKAKPRIHCFGHIHEAWGAYLAKWGESAERGDQGAAEGVFKSASRTIMDLDDFWPVLADDDEGYASRVQMLKKIRREGGIEIDLTALEASGAGKDQTLFLNAAVMDLGYRPVQSPWIVDIDLPQKESG